MRPSPVSLHGGTGDGNPVLQNFPFLAAPFGADDVFKGEFQALSVPLSSVDDVRRWLERHVAVQDVVSGSGDLELSSPLIVLDRCSDSTADAVLEPGHYRCWGF